jgi:hypothetical protein
VLPIRPQPLRCPPESAALASVVMQFLPGLGAPPAASESDSSSEPSTGSVRQGWRGGLKEMVVAEYLKLTTAMAKASAAGGRMPLSPPLSPHPGHKTARGHPQVHYSGQREMQLSPPHLPRCASTSQIAALGELALEPMPSEGAGFRKPKLEVLASPGAFAALNLASPCGAPAPRWSSGDGEEGRRGVRPPQGGPPDTAAAAEPGLGGGEEGSWGKDGEQPQEPRLKGAAFTRAVDPSMIVDKALVSNGIAIQLRAIVHHSMRLAGHLEPYHLRWLFASCSSGPYGHAGSASGQLTGRQLSDDSLPLTITH